MNRKKEAERHLQETQSAIQESKFERAVVSSTRAIKFDKTDWINFFGLAEAFAEQKKYKNACSLYRHVLLMNPENALIYYNFGCALQMLGKTDESMEMYRKTIELNPTDADGYYNLAMMLTTKGEYEEAEGYFMEVLELQPSLSPEVYNCLGYAHFLQGEFEKAVPEFEKATSLNEKYALAYCNLSLVLFCENKSEEACRHFEEVLKALEEHQNQAESVKWLITKYTNEKVRLENKNEEIMSEERIKVMKAMINGLTETINLLTKQLNEKTKDES